MARPFAFVLFLHGLVVTGCAPPSERLSRVSAAEAPAIAEPEEEGAPEWVLHTGDLVRVLRTLRPRFAWKGPIEGKMITRDDELIELSRAGGEGTGFGFRKDLGGEVAVPTAAWLCRRMEAGPDCEKRLHRIALDDRGETVLAYEACFAPGCRAALARGRKVSSLTINGLTDMRIARVGNQTVAMASARWVRAPNWTGGSVFVLHVDDALRRGLEIVTDEVDARHAGTQQRHGTLTIEGDTLRFRGEKQSLMGPQIMSTAKVDETYRLAAAPAK